MFVERKEYNNVITLKLVFPTRCNARCSFCYNKDKKVESDKDSFKKNFIKSIDYILKEIGNKNPVSLDITGGEPTIDVELFKFVMDRLREYDVRSKVCRVTLTTNGTRLEEVCNYMKGVVDYVNISVHDFRTKERERIFCTYHTLSDEDYKRIVSLLENCGIKTSVAAVVFRKIDNFDKWRDDFIRWAKDCGFISLRMRCDVFWEDAYLFDEYLTKAINDEKFEVITYENTTDSHWCRLRMNDKFRVFFLHGVLDTSLKTKGIEYVIDTDGKCYCDYYRKTPIEKYSYEIGKIFDMED